MSVRQRSLQYGSVLGIVDDLCPVAYGKGMDSIFIYSWALVVHPCSAHQTGSLESQTGYIGPMPGAGKTIC